MSSPARGYSWPPFEPGNTAGLRHGLYSERSLAEWRDAARDALARMFPWAEDADAAALNRAESLLARCLAADSWRDEHGTFADKFGNPWPFEERVQAWENMLGRILERFGGSKASRIELGLVVEQTRRVARAEPDLGRLPLEERGAFVRQLAQVVGDPLLELEGEELAS